MTNNKDYKKLVKQAYDDKVNNIIYLLKFLNSKGGSELIKEYFGEAIPNYVKKYDAPGDAKRWIYRQWLKRDPVGNMKKVVDVIREGSEFYIPPKNFNTLEDEGNQLVSEIKCKYLKNLIKRAKKFGCEFDMRENYCKNACIPILTVLYSELYLDLSVELTKNGCKQTVVISESLLGDKSDSK